MEVLDTTYLVSETLSQLRQHGLKTQWREEPSTHNVGHDGIARLEWCGRAHEFRIVLKTTLRPSTAPFVLKNFTQMEDCLLIAPSITGSLTELVRGIGLNYIDLAGNCHISCPEFLIDIRGQRGATIPKEASAGFTKTDLRVILALTVDPQLATASARELGERVGVSHGAAHLAVSKLTERGFLTKNGLRRGKQLMDEWTQSYLTRSGAHRTTRTVFVDEKPQWHRILAGSPEEIQLSGESAAEILEWPIHSTSAVLYTNTFTSVARLIRGRSYGDGFPIEVRTPILAPSDNPSGIAASMLIQADMLGSHEPRQVEIAKETIRHDKNLRYLQQTL